MSQNIEHRFKDNKFLLNDLFFSFQVTTNVIFFKGQIGEFWLFLEKYLKKIASSSSDNTCKYEQLFQKWSDRIPIEWKSIDNLQERLYQINHKSNLNKLDLLEFRNILLVFIDFTYKRREKKLENLNVFQENLPIFEYKQTILEKIKTNSVVLIAGDTGCGKSTQVPQYLLRNGFQRICCTQPRRIACIALANRLSYETADEYGSDIGYQIRFEKSKTKFTKILFLTEGLLLRQMIADPLLSNYEVIILDEIHERHLSTDFLLGAIKCLLHKRKNDLKVILMSATVNCELFSNYFGQCLVIQVPGRLYPIKTEYFPPDKINIFKANQSNVNPEEYVKILQHIDSRYPSTERGDVLVFLSGFAEIEAVGERLKTYANEKKSWIVLYLHSGLPLAEQDKVFDMAAVGVRKCILSTNIAETSITIDGIRFVIDSGKVKEMYYQSNIRMQRLQEIWISKASAEQRKGRAGRTGPGICYRLYSQNDFNSFVDFSKPEIQRTSLDSLILNMISMGLNDVRKFPFIEAPNSLDIENTVKSLIQHDALDQQERITYLGRILSKLPVDVSIGKMLIYSICMGMNEYALSMAACLSVQSLTSIRSKNNLQLFQERQPIISSNGDPFSNLNFYRKWLSMKSRGQNTRAWCKRLGLEEQRFHEITKLRRQFEEILRDSALIDHNDQQDTSLTKNERLEKHGQRKLYKRLKNEIKSNKHKKAKILHLDHDQDNHHNDKEDLQWNFKELQFNLLFDWRYFMEIERKHLINSSEIDLLKVILFQSFYPQIAIADLDNSYENGSDLMFHTKDKPFVVIHPSSVYYSQADLLRQPPVELSKLGPLSNEHSLLGYVQFIETNKSYICNCYQIPALQTLLLSTRDLETNQDCSRLVCDEWLEIRFESCQDGQHCIIKACQIRQKFSELLKLIFECSNQDEYNHNVNIEPNDISSMKKSLADQIKMFMKEHDRLGKYSIRRLLAADLKTIYKIDNPDLKFKDLSKFKKYEIVHYFMDHLNDSDQHDNERQEGPCPKGGYRYSFIRYNCLKQDSVIEKEKTDNNRKMFTCNKCHKQMFVTPIEQIRHEEICD